MKSNTKDWIQYSSAITLLASGVGLAFLSFFLNEFNIAEGVLLYIAQAFVFAGGIFGVSIYIKTKISEFKSEMISDIQKKITAQNRRDKQFLQQEEQRLEQQIKDNLNTSTNASD